MRIDFKALDQTMDKFNDFKFTGPKLDDLDFPKIGAQIGVGEDIVHAVIDTETSGSSTDRNGRMKALYEPHVAYRNSGGSVRQKLMSSGLAYRSWGTKGYPKDSYPRIKKAKAIDETVALLASSWGFPQILGENFALAGYESVQAMVLDMLKDEDNQLQAMVNFIKNAGLDDELRVLEAKLRAGETVTADDCRPFVRGYNGSQYAKNGYHIKFARNLNKWAAIPDTPYEPDYDNWLSDEEAIEDVTPYMYSGVPHPTVKRVQELLDAAGYPEVGSFDGRWGTKTRAAVLAFRADHDLPLVAEIDDALLAVLATAKPREIGEERRNATVSDLRKAGAEDVKVADASQVMGGVIGGSGALGLLAKVSDQLDQHGGMIETVVGFVQPMQSFILDNIWILMAGAGGFVAYQAYRSKTIRVEKHRTGQDVSE